MTQLKFNLQSRITTGKKTERLSVAVSGEFIEFLDMLASRQNLSRGELAYRYILQGMQASLGEVFMAELYEDKQISEIMGRF